MGKVSVKHQENLRLEASLFIYISNFKQLEMNSRQQKQYSC
ncbi:hypothetical protein ACSS31_02270 [Priestia megaterium]